MKRSAATTTAAIGRVFATISLGIAVASCSATGVPQMDINSAGFAAPAPTALAPATGDTAESLDAAGAPATGGDLPATVAFRPTANPVAASAMALAAVTDGTKPATPSTPNDSVPSPKIIDSTAPAPETAIRLAAMEQPTRLTAEPLAEPVVPRPETVVTAAPSNEPVFENAPASQPVKKKGGLFAAFFASPKPAAAATIAAPKAPRRLAAEEAAPVVLASAGPAQGVSLREALTGTELPGVRKSALFEITRRNGVDDDSDVDLTEDNDAPVRVASAAGLARLAPNGLLVQHEGVDTACLKPALVKTLKQIERHYGKRVVVTSGYRSPSHNKRVRGARKSLHMACAAADIQISGVGKWELARYARTMPGRGGVGTYCHTESVHIDVGPERDWNWRCRRSKRK